MWKNMQRRRGLPFITLMIFSIISIFMSDPIINHEELDKLREEANFRMSEDLIKRALQEVEETY